MKKAILLLILSIPFLMLAQSPAKLVEQGRYDEAIEKCVDRLKKDRGDKTKLYAALKQAYETANALDLQKVAGLKATGAPDIWYEVFKLYYGIQKRYEKVSGISDKLQNDRVNLQLVEYPEDLEAAREHAGEYLYVHAMSLLKTDDPEDAHVAFQELLKITKLFSEYKDVERMMRKALANFGKVALLEVKNNSDAALPPDFLADMEDIPLTVKEKEFLGITAKAGPGEFFPLILQIEITLAKVSPGTVSEKEYTTSHKAPETFETAYKDSTKKEEDKKHPDYNKCEIKEIFQLKTALMKGNLKYIEGGSGKVLYVVPVTAEARFENRTATASGDMFACPPEVFDILNKPKKEFPKNADMLFELGKEFKFLVKGIVWDEAFLNK
ncbi:MAG: hypothetical protein RQ761_10570 [Bacteroidales bacterium]|nr:hypothetical protein [Bacteroidales bacterium]